VLGLKNLEVLYVIGADDGMRLYLPWFPQARLKREVQDTGGFKNLVVGKWTGSRPQLHSPQPSRSFDLADMWQNPELHPAQHIGFGDRLMAYIDQRLPCHNFLVSTRINEKRWR
jgi:hypothetical protein